ncbi:MAG: HEPN domain-containing protein [Bacteroidaceae bacterium]|nr:HEPN domain-containing protein [Bacteroidaceae bacterium]
MSLNEENREIVIQLELERVDKMLSQVEGLVEKKYWDILANRLYYALFHAVSALLVSDKREVGSHKGAAIRFHQFYVKTGIFSMEDGSFYSQMETLREKADYNCFFDVTEAEILSRIEPAKELVVKIKAYINCH